MDFDTFSDVYKSTHGVRPTNTADMNYMLVLEREEELRKTSVAEFEASVSRYADAGLDRATAIRCMMDNEHGWGSAFYTAGDVDYYIRNNYHLPEDSAQYAECMAEGMKNLVEFDHF